MAAKIDPLLLSLFRTGRDEDYAKGEVIIQAGEKPRGVYLIEDGHVVVYSITDNGEKNIHIIYRPGEVFPLIWAVNGNLRNVYYEALNEVSLCRLSRDTFNGAIEMDSKFAQLLLQQSVEQFRIFADRLDNLQYTGARQRVIYRLLFLAGRFGHKVEGKWVIEAPISQEIIAASINVARETASREIEKLEADGIIGYHNHHIVLKDLARMRSELGEPTSPDIWGLT